MTESSHKGLPCLQTKAELRAIAAREDYAAHKAACSPEVWAAVQAAAAKRLREVEK